MARRGRPANKPFGKSKNRPLRTREHIIADLSVLHFQWIAARAGFVTEIPQHDYGYDLVLFTYTEAGEAEGGLLLLQFKVTDNIESYTLAGSATISYPIERQHIALWRNEPMPVILIIYDAIKEQAFWLYVQPYLLEATDIPLFQAEVSVRVPLANVVEPDTMLRLRRIKNDVINRISEVSLHYEASNIPGFGEGPDGLGI